ncbi:acyltransferase [Sphingomonas sp. SUN019]|uniref:acyltransferase n=1 Tax=Sphingomonas sp. SUN019 TaxID=2937788 RepID=UPI002164BF9E|nr:acyltransferase [Sphingomonas sp. SUN019]UVO50923.1 acyltransferase [Sphingomonas sp. SUN019]
MAALRFPLVALVVYIHARSGTITFGDGVVSVESAVLDTVKTALSEGVARTAVPLFFLLSGYLLFHAQEGWSWSGFAAKLRRRVDTLLVPYLFWNIALYAMIAAAQSTSLRIFFSSSGVLRDMTWGQQAAWVLGLQRYPIAYQFWFIRDLMILVLLAPAFFLLARRVPVAVVVTAVLGLCWMVDWWPIDIPAIEAALFFFVGVVAGVHGRNLFRGLPLIPVMLGYGVLLAAFLLSRGTRIESFVQHGLVATGIVLAVAIVRSLPPLALQRLASLAGASFFVFATHEPLTTALLKISYRVFPISPGMALAVYLLVPLVVIAITLVGYRIALALAPSLTRRVTGR